MCLIKKIKEKKRKETEALVQKRYNDLISSDFYIRTPMQKEMIIRTLLDNLENKYKLIMSFERCVELLSEEPNSKKRAKYYEYLSNLKIYLGPNMCATIKAYIDENRLDIFKLPKYLNDPKFYQNENDETAAKKLKTIMFFSKPENLEKWHIDGYDIIAHLKNEDGTWKTYCEMSEVIDEIEKLHGDTD